MEDYSFSLLLKGKGEFLFYLIGDGELKIESEDEFHITTTIRKFQNFKRYIFHNSSDSISEFILKNKDKETKKIFFSIKNCSLFFFWGPGAILSHFSDDKFPFLISECSSSLFFFLPSFIKKLNLCFWGIKRGNLKFFKNGKLFHPHFANPENCPWFSSSLENNKNTWYELKIDDTNPFHIGVVEPVFFLIGNLKKVYLKKLKIQSDRVARVEIWKNSFLIGTGFTERDKTFVSFLPQGKYTIKIKSGFYCIPVEKFINLKKDKKVIIKLKERFIPDKNWKSGDAHIHSYYLDGAHSPEIISFSSKANGLDFIFLTDEEPEKIPGSGEIKKYSEKNKFLCLTGQEIGAENYHLNILNNPVKIKNTDVSEIIKEVKNVFMKYKKEIEVMLNHPWTENLNEKCLPYFKSWWVIDRFKDINVVENFGIKEWFKRLNNGRKITGLWTTDSHDAVLYPPGDRRFFVYTSGKLNISDIFKGIKNGKVFCIREPGGWIDFRVNEKIIGEIVKIKKSAKIKIKVTFFEPIGKILIIFNGRKIKQFDGKKKLKFRKTISLRIEKDGWILLLVYSGIKKKFSSHASEPLTKENLLGFTNPIYISKG
jgi:hypothetical protein